MHLTPTRLQRWLPGIALVCTLAVPAQAQTTAGRISGQIRDASGRTLPGATVLVSPQGSPAGTSPRAATADANGLFELTGVAPGSYTVTTSFLGYRSATQTVTVSDTQAAVVDARLSEDALLMNDVVVTGTFNPQTKLESSVSITTLDSRQIQNRVSRGTADLLMAVPGFRVNSDGGEAANSVSARGLPVNAESGFGFIQLLEDGLPILETGSLTFAKTDIHFRVDETIDRLEVVRGGSASIFANNAPGGVVNFLSKTGSGTKIGGLVRLTGGDQGFYSDRTGAAQLGGLQRIDANLGGPIAGTPFKFNVGGFYRYDVGVKYAGFPANVGGGVKGNVTYSLPDNRGYVRLYGKYLNDRVAYYTSVPYQNLNRPEQIPGGPDLRRGTMYSEHQRYQKLPNPFNNGEGTLERDLANGQHTRYKAVSLEVVVDLGHGFTLTDNARLLDANLSTDGIYDLRPPLAGAALGGSFLAGYRPLGATGYQFSYADDPTNTPIDITTLNGNGLVNIAGIFPDDKPATNAINRLQLSKTVGSHQLTGGIYASRYNIKERLSYNTIVQEVANRPRLLNLTLTTSPTSPFRGAPVRVTENGFLGYSFGTAGGILANTNNTTQVLSYFLGDEWAITDRLRADLGLRYETTHTKGTAAKSSVLQRPDARFSFLGATGSNGGRDGDYTTLFDNSYLANNGEVRTWDFRFETLNGSIGLNYKLDDKAAVYARYSNAGVVPTNDQFAFQANPDDPTGNTTARGQVQRVQQAEGGVKASTDRLGLGLTLFYSRNQNIPFTVQQANPGGGFTLRQDRGTVQSSGIETEITFQVVRGLTLRGIGTLQAPRIVEFQLQATATSAPFSIAGNRLEDTPDILLEGGADYQYKGFNAFASYRYFGERYANRRNTILLPGYGVLFGGVGYNFDGVLKGVQLRVQGSNLLDTKGFGDAAARNGETITQEISDSPLYLPNGAVNPSQYNLVRSILPRNITASVGYAF
ncbi:TonB-dependent receptor [Hymenobacter sp. BT175]|uniref:TonB-dependent receptor n=1 Tax=Hymenobacter translucens TaxID=2886507 RepID=UPI001D0EF36A|nr:TonB-dependent receptor [Hymenobacter translucens]MCC2544845.1 TonB-dependent receptor [Hymenobacter translucens]